MRQLLYVVYLLLLVSSRHHGLARELVLFALPTTFEAPSIPNRGGFAVQVSAHFHSAYSPLLLNFETLLISTTFFVALW